MNLSLARSSARFPVVLILLFTTPPSGAAPTDAQTLTGRLLPVGGDTADWRVLVAPRLFAELPPESSGIRSVHPKPDGSFSLRAVGGGQQYVCAYVGTRLDVESVVPVRLSSRAAPPEITLKPNAPREQVRFVLRRADGQPLGQPVKVHLYNVHGEIDARRGGFLSDEAGDVRVSRLPATRYALWVEPIPGQNGAPGVRVRNLLVTPGRNPQTFSLAVPQGGTVRGRLVFHDGKTPATGYVVAVQTGTIPEKNVPVAAWPAAYARGAQDCYTQCQTGPDGAFTLTGLTPGKHLLDIRRPGRPEPWCTTGEVNVVPGQVTDLGDVRVAQNGWRWLFNRKSLAGWTESDFYGRAEVRVENDRVVLTEGHDMTGITWTGPLPRIDYEVTLQAMRVAGSDFFCGLTFPVKKDPCTLILGGWGGGVVGLSSLDGMDASENETSNYVEFENRRWYRVRLGVTAERIQAWLDMQRIVDVALGKKEISIRIECEPSKPFGIATWCTTGALRDLRIRKLDR